MTNIVSYEQDLNTLVRADFFMKHFFKAGYEHLKMSLTLYYAEVVLFLKDKDEWNKVYEEWHALLRDDEELAKEDLCDKDTQLYTIRWERFFENNKRQ